MPRVLVISPGVLPLPPVLGGAVENLISRLHPIAARRFDMEYVSVRAPAHGQARSQMFDRARMHYIDSIDPLTDFTHDNQFELHESHQWPAYKEFCTRVTIDRSPDIVHVHNEAHLLGHLRRAVPEAKLVLHINDEVVSRMGSRELAEVGASCDFVLACSKHVEREVRRAFAAAAVQPPPMEVFYNFVDVAEYDPSAVGGSGAHALREELAVGSSGVVLFVGRMIEQKGPHLLLRAFRRALEAHPDAYLVFVGAPWYSRANDSPFVRTIQREAAPIADHIRFTGYVDHGLMPYYYGLADIVAVPSIWDDPSPFVAYEAQAMAKPVVASTRGGIPEIVADRETGRCIDVFNTLLFADIVSEWLAAPDLARQTGSRGRQRVVQQFGIDRAGRQLLDVYDTVLQVGK